MLSRHIRGTFKWLLLLGSNGRMKIDDAEKAVENHLLDYDLGDFQLSRTDSIPPSLAYISTREWVFFIVDTELSLVIGSRRFAAINLVTEEIKYLGSRSMFPRAPKSSRKRWWRLW
jgi:hypothetical protein